MPSGLWSPAASARVQLFLPAIGERSPRTYLRARRRGSTRANLPASRDISSSRAADQPSRSSRSMSREVYIGRMTGGSRPTTQLALRPARLHRSMVTMAPPAPAQSQNKPLPAKTPPHGSAAVVLGHGERRVVPRIRVHQIDLAVRGLIGHRYRLIGNARHPRRSRRLPNAVVANQAQSERDHWRELSAPRPRTADRQKSPRNRRLSPC